MKIISKGLLESKKRALAVVWAVLVALALAIMVVLLSSLLAAKTAHAVTTFTVDRSDDPDLTTIPTAGDCTAAAADDCSLRGAINAANANNNDPTVVDVIHFAIPGAGPHTISPAPVLPPITEAVTINGYTESMDESTPAKENTLTIGNNANLLIELDGADAGNGLEIEADNSTVKGLVIRNWENGVLLDTTATNNTVRGNFIGTDTPGPQTSNNIGAVALGDANTIGGTTAAARNIISDNGFGVQIGSANGGNKVQGNYIGTNAAGDTALGNNIGVVIDGSPKNIIGGATGTARNVISGNSTFGIRIGFTGATLNEVQGNYIGISAAGDTTLANSGDGVSIQSDADANTIGGTTAAARNIISGNSGDGVEVFFTVSDPNGGATGNRILSNSIYNNAKLGIDLIHSNDPPGITPNDPGDFDGGANNLQNYPHITSAKPITKRVKGKTKQFTVIKGTLNSTSGETFTIQLFRNLSGEDEGRALLTQFTSITTDATGDATFRIRVPRSRAPVGSTVTATATNNSTGDTSEFSAAKTVG